MGNKSEERNTKETFSRYDTADYLKSDEECGVPRGLHGEAGDRSGFIAVALGNIARAHGMVQLVKEYRPHSGGALYRRYPKGNPSLGPYSRW